MFFPYIQKLWSKVIKDVIHGRAIVFDWSRAREIDPLRISLVGVVKEKFRCLCATQSLASDHFRLLRERGPRDPPIVVPSENVQLGH